MKKLIASLYGSVAALLLGIAPIAVPVSVTLFVPATAHASCEFTDSTSQLLRHDSGTPFAAPTGFVFARVRPDDNTSSAAIFNSYLSSDSPQYFMLSLNTTEQARFTTRGSAGGSVTQQATTSASVTPGDWTTVYGYSTATNSRVAGISGVEETSPDTNTVTHTSPPNRFSIGLRVAANTDPFDGLIWDVLVGNGVPTAPELAELTAASSTAEVLASDYVGDHGVAYWNFGAACSGTSLEDQIGAFDLTNSGSVAYNSAAPTFASGEFDTTPSVTSQTSTAYTIGGSVDGAAAVAAVACAKDSTAPSIAQVEAGNCTGDVAALATDSDTPTNDFTLTLTLANGFPVADLYVTDGTNLTTRADEELDCAAGRLCQSPFTSVDANSPFDEVGAVAGDYGSIDDATDPDMFFTFLDPDATVGYDAFGSTARQLISAWWYDVSAAALNSLLFVYNNVAPFLTEAWPLSSVPTVPLYEIGVDPAFESELYVADVEGDDITWAVTSGAMPTSWSLNATTGEITTGATACGPFTFTLTAEDEYGAATDLPSSVHVGARIPDVAGDDEATATTAIEALCGFTVAATDTDCDAVVAAGDVISTNPTIGTLVEEDTEVELLLSSGECPPGRGGADILILRRR